MAKQAVDKVTKEIALDFTWEDADKALELMKSLHSEIDKMRTRRDVTIADMASLETAGIEYFGTTYKDGKYLYKLYPSTAGEARRRVYVGADEEAIKTEMAKLERYHQHARLKRQLDEYEAKMSRLVYTLRYFRW